MAKVTPKKTANAAAKTSATSKKTATKAAKTSSTAKKKPTAKKAKAEEIPALPDVSEENNGDLEADPKGTTKKTAAKKTAAKKTAKKKVSASASADSPAVAKKSAAKVSASTTAKKSTKTATTSAATTKSTKKTTSKKVPAAKIKKASIEIASAPDSDSDENDMDMDLPVSTQPAVVPYERGSSGHYMDNDQLDHFRLKLTEWKQQLMEEVDRTVGHMKDDATNFPDPNDRATQEEEFSLELRTRDRERKLIKKINEAQKRIDDDEYGYCETCGIEIGVNRLEARPTAELCIDCKTLEEIRERQTA